MSLQEQHLFTILKDILESQQLDCCGSVSECEQIGRLVKSLLMNGNFDQQTKDLLTDIYNYCLNAVNSANIEQHIEAHQHQLSQWVSDIEQFS